MDDQIPNEEEQACACGARASDAVHVEGCVRALASHVRCGLCGNRLPTRDGACPACEPPAEPESHGQRRST